VVDNVSYEFVKGATVDYVEELIFAAFLVSFKLHYLFYSTHEHLIFIRTSKGSK
jgi:hypothetical protein